MGLDSNSDHSFLQTDEEQVESEGNGRLRTPSLILKKFMDTSQVQLSERNAGDSSDDDGILVAGRTIPRSSTLDTVFTEDAKEVSLTMPHARVRNDDLLKTTMPVGSFPQPKSRRWQFTWWLRKLKRNPSAGDVGYTPTATDTNHDKNGGSLGPISAPLSPTPDRKWIRRKAFRRKLSAPAIGPGPMLLEVR